MTSTPSGRRFETPKTQRVADVVGGLVLAPLALGALAFFGAIVAVAAVLLGWASPGAQLRRVAPGLVLGPACAIFGGRLLERGQRWPSPTSKRLPQASHST